MLVAMTGTPIAHASIAARGNPSRRDGKTKMSISSNRESMSSRDPRNRTPSLVKRSISRSLTASALPGSLGPTTTASNGLCEFALSHSIAWKKSLYPFSHTKRPTIPTTGTSSRRPSSRRNRIALDRPACVVVNRSRSIPLPRR